MSPAMLAVVILTLSVLFFFIAYLFPKVRLFFLVAGFCIGLIGFYSYYSNLVIPQPTVYYPFHPEYYVPLGEAINTMPVSKLAEIGEVIIFGKVGGYEQRGIGRGQCPLCHVFKPTDISKRAPNLSGIVKRAAERIREPRYLHPDTVQHESFPGSGRATTADEYIAESLSCPSCYVVQGFGTKGTNDKESGEPPIHEPPLSLTIEEEIAVHIWLYVHDGVTPPPVKVIRAAYEKFIPEAERRHLGPGGKIITSQGTIVTPTPPGPPIALASDTPEWMITKMGCNVCHQIPGIYNARFGMIGPLLIEKTLAEKRISSPEYQAQVKAGQAHAKTPKEYVIESIVNPNAFIVPEFVQNRVPGVSPMIQDYDQKFTYKALEKIADYLLTLDCESAKKDSLPGPPLEPISKICGDTGH